jgi:hypothetical protein
MLGGSLPFKGDHEQAIIHGILNDQPESLPGLPKEVAEIVQTALAKNPAGRYQNCHELIEALEQAERSLGIRSPRRVFRREKPRHKTWPASPVLWAAVAISLAVLARFLLLHPFKKIPFSEREWILVSDFENQTGDEVFDRSLNTALTVSLQQSRYVNVFPRSRVKETLQRMGKKDPERLDEESVRWL